MLGEQTAIKFYFLNPVLVSAKYFKALLHIENQLVTIGTLDWNALTDCVHLKNLFNVLSGW